MFLTRTAGGLGAALLLAACAPVLSSPDPSGSPLTQGQEWQLLPPPRAMTPADSRLLPVGSRSLLTDGTVSYAAQPMAGGASALFRFVPGGEGRSVLVAGYSESGQVNVCVLRGAGDTQGRPQSGVFFSLPDLDALWNQPGYRTYLNTALTDGLEPCTLTRLR